ncbi:MAG: hypothetical protein ACK55Z_01335 [bacterium]
MLGIARFHLSSSVMYSSMGVKNFPMSKTPSAIVFSRRCLSSLSG